MKNNVKHGSEPYATILLHQSLRGNLGTQNVEQKGFGSTLKYLRFDFSQLF